MLDLGGALHLWGACDSLLLVFVCDTLCIHVYLHALHYILVMVRLVTCVLSTLILKYMSYHLIMLICFASAFYFDSNELYFLYSCLIHIYCIHHVGLGHVSMSNSFALIVKSLYEPSMLKTSSLTHTLGCIVINHQKGEG